MHERASGGALGRTLVLKEESVDLQPLDVLLLELLRETKRQARRAGEQHLGEWTRLHA